MSRCTGKCYSNFVFSSNAYTCLLAIFNYLKELQSLKLNIIENSESIIPLNTLIKYYFIVIVKHERVLTLI